MNITLKDGTTYQIDNSSNPTTLLIFRMADLHGMLEIAEKLTEDNLSKFTIDNVKYQNYVCYGGSWNEDQVAFNIHQKSEMEFMKDYVNEDDFPDEEAIHVPSLYDVWKVEQSYTVGKRVRFHGILYKCLQAHTSQTGWAPDVASSLWAEVLVPDPEDIPVWKQPESSNPYMKGDKVHYKTLDDPVYESIINNNVWSPEAYPQGWKVV